MDISLSSLPGTRTTYQMSSKMRTTAGRAECQACGGGVRPVKQRGACKAASCEAGNPSREGRNLVPFTGLRGCQVATSLNMKISACLSKTELVLLCVKKRILSVRQNHSCHGASGGRTRFLRKSSYACFDSGVRNNPQKCRVANWCRYARTVRRTGQEMRDRMTDELLGQNKMVGKKGSSKGGYGIDCPWLFLAVLSVACRGGSCSPTSVIAC
jgi:hypothetical protein